MKYSPYSLNLYYQCPYKFKLAYIDGAKPLPPSEKMIIGKTIHEVLAKYYEIIPNTITPKEVPLFLAQALKEINVSSDRLNYLLRGFRRFEERRLTWNLNPKPIAIEKYFERGMFHGILDVIFKRHDQKLVGVDWKSGRVTMDNVSNIIQGFVYVYIANLDEMVFVSLISGNEMKLSARELLTFKDVLRKIINGIKAKNFEKNIGDHCKTCEFSLACNLREEDIC